MMKTTMVMAAFAAVISALGEVGSPLPPTAQFRRVASEAKRRKGGDEPDPAPASAASAS